MSDDNHASNGFTLTEAGRELVRAQGMVCQCALCGTYNYPGPALAVDPLCVGCQSSMEAYGMNELEGPGCGEKTGNPARRANQPWHT